ncbi:DNA-binding NarL/FixJ family response regulator [Streptomyces sp. V3I8]|uniref:hypothetical protein n=1 Tax=Streptomyces sp. V3I8 TaxID=3042279 RepID=UPI002786B3BA|nr:hypothetical protein [Streptomyces sp. V3I8]MDQ1040758.1 DNA-binding NarL/FixJ family response regulator [Streptomyces sp. V3I8]
MGGGELPSAAPSSRTSATGAAGSPRRRTSGLAGTARAELAAIGSRSRPLHGTETDALTAYERAAAEPAVRGLTTTAIAQELHTRETTVVRLLSAVCRKAGSDLTGPGTALRTARGDGPGPGG